MYVRVRFFHELGWIELRHAGLRLVSSCPRKERRKAREGSLLVLAYTEDTEARGGGYTRVQDTRTRGD